MKTEGHPEELRSNGLGANFDIDTELTGAKDTGEYFDAQNLRVSSKRGNQKSAEKIKGEEVLYPDTATPGDWFCMNKADVNGNIVEFWADKLGTEDPIIRINGVISGQSPDFPWLFANGGLQVDKNENCLGGEVFTTDFTTPPMILNVQDIIDSLVSDPTKYFSNFNPSLYTINLDTPIDIPIFIELENVGGGGGLPVGEYQYSLRYVNEAGDRTNWGPLTPPIPVVQALSSASAQYPNTKTYGGAADLAFPTGFGPKIRFRVTNLANYDFIEVRRIAYNFSGGIDVIPQGQIVAKLDISEGEISIREFVDPSDSNVEDTLADSEETQQLGVIAAAKAIRYHDKRLNLMNVKYASRELNLTFEEFNGKKIFPIVQGLGKSGHSDPVNHAYYKNNMSGERLTYGVEVFDGSGGRSFVQTDDDLKNIQTPNRRAEMDADSQLISNGNFPTAANLQSTVTPVFEAFDLEDAVAKSDLDSFKNIMNDDAGLLGTESNLVASKQASKVNDLSPDAGFGSTVQAKEVGYQPYRPTDQNDGVAGHNYRVNPEVDPGAGTGVTYDPEGFAPSYYSKGFAVGGVSGFPSWAKAFSVVRKKTAGRVVCQGIGMYSLNPGDFNAIGNASTANKDRDKFWFHSPDIAAGLVNQATLEDISSNPQNYKVQLVSPLGFFSEMYSFEENSLADARDRLVDMITYARVLHDEGQINPGELGTMGVGSAGNRYVAYNRYRNTGDTAGGDAFAVPEGGDKLIGIDDITSKSEGRGVYYELALSELVYNNQFTGGSGSNDFDDSGLQSFTEPMYIVNIVQEGKDVPDNNIDNFLGTGHWQKIESIIGQGDGTPGQSFLLVDERWEDCIPDLSSTGPRSTDEVYICLKDSLGVEQTFMDVTFLTPAAIALILTDITTLGFYTSGSKQVVGLYTHTNTGNTEFNIVFNVSSFVPQADQKIIVKYDLRRPVRVFGGDTTVGESIFSPIDKEADASDDAENTQFVMNVGLPFRKFRMNPRHYIIARTTGINKIQDREKGSLGYLRQLCVMFTCESKISTHFAHNLSSPNQYFPLTHYVMRPNRFSDSQFGTSDPIQIADDNNLFEEYFDDYPQEYNLWKFGGLRFIQNYNLDYSSIGPIEFFSKPEFGFKEETDFCTAVIWSLQRAINQQDTPGLKTFLSSNRFDIDDDSGEIKKAWDARTGGKGENLYAVTEKGVCLLLTKKTILSNIQSDDLTTVASDKFIGDQYWLSREIGSNDEMWRGMSEEFIEYQQQDNKVVVETLIIPNKHSVYRLRENVIGDILDGTNFFARMNPVLKRIRPGYQDHVTGFLDHNHNEYWLQLNTQPIIDFDPCIGMVPEEKRTFVFSNDTSHWLGTYTYDFDQYLYSENEVHGMRGLETFKLEVGFKINGSAIHAFLLQAFSPAQAIEKEFIKFKVNTGVRGSMKPSKIEFYDATGSLLCALDPSINGPNYLLQYDGWEQFIPRKFRSASASRDRVQERLIVCKIIHNFEEDFKIIDSIVQFKLIK